MAVRTTRKPIKKAKKPPKPGGDTALLSYLSSLIGPIPSDENIRSDASSYVRSQIDPIVQQITASNRGALESGSRYIRGLTDQYAADLAPFGGQVRADYDKAAGESKQAGDDLGSFLSDRGAQAYDEVAGKLKAINAPDAAVADAAGGARGVAAGAAGDAATRGFIAQDNLIANKAAAGSLADQYPAFAKMEGQQGLNDLASQLSGDLSDKIGSLTSSVPGLVSDTFERLRGRADDKRSSRASLLAQFLGGSLDRATQLKIAKLGLGTDQSKLAIDWSNVLGYKTDQGGNPVLDASGNLIPTADVVNAAGNSAADQKKAHATAIKNRNAATIKAGNAVRSLVKAAGTQQYDVKQEPVVLRRDAHGRPVYKKVGGGFTLDKSQAEQHTVKVPLPKPVFNQLLHQAMLLPEIQQLGPRFALKPAQVRKIVTDALASSGIMPAAKPSTSTAAGRYQPGERSDRPG